MQLIRIAFLIGLFAGVVRGIQPSPAPSEVAYTNKGVWLIDVHTKSTRRLTEPLDYDRPLTWSPDGSKLLFWKHSAIGWDIWSIDADGENAKNLTNVQTRGCRSPCFSPDGKRIAFMRDDPEGLYVMDADGSNQKRLTERGDRDEPPSWSPDGKLIAYVQYTSAGSNSSRGDIFVIDQNGKNDRRVTSNQGSSRHVIWSPDGKTILFEGYRAGGVQACTINADGTNERRLTTGTNYDPIWSPDGKRIAFIKEQNGKYTLWVMNANGEESKQVAPIEGRPSKTTWSPDGRQLAFSSDISGRSEIFVVDSDGKNQTQLTTGGGEWPAWRPKSTK